MTDIGLVHLKELKSLESLSLFNTKVTDMGLVHLRGLTRLRWLDLEGTPVTKAGVRGLRKVLPGCKISK